MKFYWLLEKQTKQGSVYVGEDHQGTLFATAHAVDARLFASEEDANMFKETHSADVAKEFKAIEHGFEDEPQKMGVMVELHEMSVDQLNAQLEFLQGKFAQHHVSHQVAVKNLRSAVAYEHQTRQSKDSVIQRIEKIIDEKNKRGLIAKG